MGYIGNKKSKFKFDEIVKIITLKYKDENVVNKEGYIAGMGMDDNNTRWGYAVYIFDFEEVWCFDEEDLQSTGKFVPENYDMTGESIRVVVNEKGEGEIKED